MEPHRQFIKEGDLLVVSLKGKSKKGNIYVFLFSDCLVLAKKRKLGSALTFSSKVKVFYK